MNGWLIGVDAGGTNTRAEAVDPASGEVRTGRAEGANWTVHGPDLCRERIERAIGDALPAGESALSVSICMAGYYPPDHQAAVDAWATAIWPSRPVVVGTDVVGAWAGSFGGDPGLVVISGTGSICYGRSSSGAEARAGGWGPLYSDHGSAYTVGLQCLRRLSEAVDGIGPATVLEERVLRRWPELGSDLTRWLRGIYARRWAREEIALLATEVAAADADDLVAAAIIDDAAARLTELALAVERRLGGPLPLALQGGLCSASPRLRGTVFMLLERQGSALQRAEPRFSPLEGATLLAADALGGPSLLRQVRDRLSAPRG